MTDNLMSTVHPSVMHSEAFDPFGRDPEPAPSRRERTLLVLALAAILGLGAGALATLVLPRGATPDSSLGGRPTASATTTPVAPAVTPAAGPGAGAAQPVMVAGAAGPAGAADGANAGPAQNPGSPDGGSGGGTGPGTPSPPTTPVSLVATVQITSPGGAAHPAGKPLFLKVAATHPITGAPIPGYRLHWRVTRSGGHLVSTATGTAAAVNGALITPGTYRVRVEVQAKGLIGADEVTLVVPLDLAPKPTPVPPGPTPTPQVSGPPDLTVPLPDPFD